MRERKKNVDVETELKNLLLKNLAILKNGTVTFILQDSQLIQCNTKESYNVDYQNYKAV